MVTAMMVAVVVLMVMVKEKGDQTGSAHCARSRQEIQTTPSAFALLFFSLLLSLQAQLALRVNKKRTNRKSESRRTRRKAGQLQGRSKKPWIFKTNHVPRQGGEERRDVHAASGWL